jgi:hypothetical protein
MSISSSRTGIHPVRTFMAFSKSLSNKISLVASIRAFEAAWMISRPPAKSTGSSAGLERTVDGDFGAAKDLNVAEVLGGKADLIGWVEWESPRRRKISQTRSWAANGME